MKNPNTPIGGNDKLNSIIGQRNELSVKEQSELLLILQQDNTERQYKNEKDELSEILDISEYLKIFREKWKGERWEDQIHFNDDIKESIIKAVNQIPYRATTESDGSRLVEFELGGKKYKYLDINLAKHSDSRYLTSHKYDWQTKNEVMFGGMKGNDTSKRENRKLAEYVEEQKNNRKMEIPTEKFWENLISELGDKAGLTEFTLNALMRKYLTGCYGHYWINSDTETQDSRQRLNFIDFRHAKVGGASDDYPGAASLCMISVE